ncbi:MAG: imidazole glycerol phosphate synthase subunit HisH [Alphaproteobacteria bacterium]|nr:imidazole glycerol phosphate synthase subunit HisH [Alphaproteobacteria bacterium]
MTTVIVDYGSGNLRSAAKAFERAAGGGTVEVTGDANALSRADRIVLPGVGAFGDCAAGLRALPGMVEALEDNVVARGKPFLGICVGMQLMATRGLEHGVHRGLGWIEGEVRAIDGGGVKVPHMGWNDLRLTAPAHPVFAGIDTGAHVYFVHGYRLIPARESDVLAEVDYGGPVAAVVGRDNMVGTQFHPEKSQAVGLGLIANFLAWRP